MSDEGIDRTSIQNVVVATYRAISGRAGERRDWALFRTCYTPDARIAPFKLTDGGALQFDIMSPGEYVASRDPLLMANDFFEVETAHDCRIEGRIAHVFSHYEARRDPEGAPFASGVNSIELVKTGEGWKIVFETWQFTGIASASQSAG